MSKRAQPRGYFGIGIEHHLSDHNIGTLWRSAYNLGASFIFTIGRKYKKQSSDTRKAYRSIPLFQYDDFEDFYNSFPKDCRLVGIEITDNSEDVTEFKHPERCVYLLGSEGQGLTQEAMEHCHFIVEIPTKHCINVAMSGTIVMYDRLTKLKKQ